MRARRYFPMQKRLLANAEAASLMQSVQNMHENKGFLRSLAQRANARIANFAPLAGISLPFPFRPGIAFGRVTSSQQIGEWPQSADRLDQALALQRG